MASEKTLYDSKTIAVVVPVFNPERGLLGLCDALAALFGVVIVVDDGSTENQDDFSRLPSKCELVRHEHNRGKGRAIKSAIEHLRKCHPEVTAMVCCDGDGQHEPHDVEKVAVHAMQTGRATLGVRNFQEMGVPLRSRFGNVLTSFLVRTFFRFPIYDTQTGLRAIPSRLFGAFETLQGERYEYEMRQFGLLKTMGESFEQIPIKTIYIENNRASHFRPIVDSIRVYKGLFGGPFVRFCASSIFGFVVDNLVFTIVLLLLQSFGLARRYDILVSLALARIVSATANYMANRLFVFKSEGPVVSSYARYWVLVLFIGVMSYVLTACLSALSDARGLMITVIKIVAETGLFFVSYKLQKRWVFS